MFPTQGSMIHCPGSDKTCSTVPSAWLTKCRFYVGAWQCYKQPMDTIHFITHNILRIVLVYTQQLQLLLAQRSQRILSTLSKEQSQRYLGERIQAREVPWLCLSTNRDLDVHHLARGYRLRYRHVHANPNSQCMRKFISHVRQWVRQARTCSWARTLREPINTLVDELP